NRSFENGVVGSTYSALEWWDISADGVDQLKEVQRGLLENATSTVSQLYEEGKKSLNWNLFILIAIVVLVSAIIYFTILQISSSLKELRLAAEKLAAGSTDFK